MVPRSDGPILLRRRKSLFYAQSTNINAGSAGRALSTWFYEHPLLLSALIASSADLEEQISACAVSSENTQQANLRAAHRKVAAARGDRLRDQHQHLHEHFEDGSAGSGEAHASYEVKENA